MIILEKWKPKKPISAIYFDGEKERYYVKRFLIEVTEKEEFFISEHSKAQLEIVATDYRPVAEVIFSKRSLEKEKVNFENFIAIKGIKAQGNQLTREKIKLVNLLKALPFEEPEEARFEEIEVVDEEVIVEQLQVKAVEKENKKIILEVVSPADKAAIALKKSIAQKKAEEQKRDDENQTKLF
jgi:topoisomerase-4 subunit A